MPKIKTDRVLTLPAMAGALHIDRVTDKTVDGGYYYRALFQPEWGAVKDTIVSVISAPSIFCALAETQYYLRYKNGSVMFLRCDPLQTLASALDDIWGK